MLPTATALGNYRQDQPQHLAQGDDAIYALLFERLAEEEAGGLQYSPKSQSPGTGGTHLMTNRVTVCLRGHDPSQ